MKKDDFVMLELFNDLVHVYFRFVILCLQTGKTLLCLPEQTFDSFFIFFIEIESFQLYNKIGKDAADLAKILSLDRLKSRLGKLCDILLCGCTVIENLLGVQHIDLFCKFTNRSLFLWSERLDIEPLTGNIIGIYSLRRFHCITNSFLYCGSKCGTCFIGIQCQMD